MDDSEIWVVRKRLPTQPDINSCESACSDFPLLFVPWRNDGDIDSILSQILDEAEGGSADSVDGTKGLGG
jgi:hypothetical protein